MVETFSLSSMLKAIGVYQVVILISRGIGFARDALVLLVLGATVVADNVFFLVGFADFLMVMIAGGGAALYLSLQLEREVSKAYFSAMIFYFLLAVVFVIFEFATSAAFGSLLYSPLSVNQSVNDAYMISIVGVVFTFPLVASYAIFIKSNKIFLQPLINIVYTLLVVFALLYLYFSDEFILELFALFILIAMLVRFLVATVFVNKITIEKDMFFQVHRDRRFYFEVLFSGLSVGVLVAVPFVFRGYLPIYGEGVYSTSTLVFKVSDMLIAFILVPVCTVVLNKYDVTFKWFVRLLLMSLVLSTLIVVFYYVFLMIFPSVTSMLADHDYNIEVVELSVLAVFVTSLSYVLGMIQIKLGNRFLLFIFSLILLILVRFPEFGGSVSGYFYNLYFCYALFIVVSIIYISFVMFKSQKDKI